tara:strand:+ start:8612 stop:10147 length:1536 start_codon:yes stop_codon:yes gene_type:complete
VLVFSFSVILSQQNNRLHYVEKRLPYPIHPYVEKTDDASRRFQSLFYETLIDDNAQNNDYDDRHINYASCRLEGNRFSFDLEGGWRWNDYSGDVTRFDIKFSIEQAVKHGLFNPIEVEEVTIQGANTIELELDRNYPERDIMDRLRQVIVIPRPRSEIPQSQYLTDFAESPVGSGPFGWDEAIGQEIHLLASDEYMLGRPFIDEVIIEKIPLLMQHWNYMQSYQQINLLLEATRFSKVSAEESPDRYTVKPYASDQVAFLMFNHRKDLFEDQPFRLAVDLCIDKERIVRDALQEEGDVLTGPFSRMSPYFNTNVRDNGYSPDSARIMLESFLKKDASGHFLYLGEPIKLRLIYDRNISDDEKNVITQIVKELRAIGISVIQRPLTPLSYRILLRKGEFDLAYFKHHFDRKAFVHQLFASNNLLKEKQYTSLNFGDYDNIEMDALVKHWLRADDRSSQQKIGQQVQSFLYEDVACIFLYSQTAYAIYVKELEPNIVPFYFFGRPHVWKFRSD